jgi:membrane-associated phospholipid phosphatase
MTSTLTQRLQRAPPRADDHHWLLVVAGIAATAGMLLLAVGGYHAGFHTLNEAGRAISDRTLESLTQSGDSLFVLSLFLALAWRYPQAVWHAVLAALIATLLSHGVKFAVQQLRPPAVLNPDSFHLLGPAWRHSSFPSGHTVTAFVAAGVLGCEWRSPAARAAALGLAAAVGYSRVAVGAHWPVDVLCGAAIGLVSAWLGLGLMDRMRWGLRARGHQFIVGALALCAVADFMRIPAYPGAQAVVRIVSCIGLALMAWHYLGVGTTVGRLLADGRLRLARGLMKFRIGSQRRR